MRDLSDLVPFHSGQVENFYLLVLGQVQMCKYIEDIQMFLLNMSFISQVKWIIYIYFMSGEAMNEI